MSGCGPAARVVAALVLAVALGPPAPVARADAGARPGHRATGGPRGAGPDLADPLRSSNLGPLKQLFLQPPLRGAGVPPDGAVDLRVTTGYFGFFALDTGSDPDRELAVDLEGVRLELQGELGWGGDLALGVALPLVVFHAGFLDPVAKVIDEVVGTPSAGRDAAGTNRYDFELRDGDGDALLAPDEGRIGLGDLRVEGRYALLRADGGHVPDLTLAVAVELPTGDDGQAHGNGAVDVAAQAVASWDLGPDGPFGLDLGGLDLRGLRTSLGLALAAPGGSPVEGLDARFGVGVFGALGYRLSPRWGLVGALDWRQSPWDGSSIDSLERDSLELSLGARFRPEPTGPWGVELAFLEDLSNGASTDFSLVASVVFRHTPRPERPRRLEDLELLAWGPPSGYAPGRGGGADPAGEAGGVPAASGAGARSTR